MVILLCERSQGQESVAPETVNARVVVRNRAIAPASDVSARIASPSAAGASVATPTARAWIPAARACDRFSVCSG